MLDRDHDDITMKMLQVALQAMDNYHIWACDRQLGEIGPLSPDEPTECDSLGHQPNRYGIRTCGCEQDAPEEPQNAPGSTQPEEPKTEDPETTTEESDAPERRVLPQQPPEWECSLPGYMVRNNVAACNGCGKRVIERKNEHGEWVARHATKGD